MCPCKSKCCIWSKGAPNRSRPRAKDAGKDASRLANSSIRQCIVLQFSSFDFNTVVSWPPILASLIQKMLVNPKRLSSENACTSALGSCMVTLLSLIWVSKRRWEADILSKLKKRWLRDVSKFHAVPDNMIHEVQYVARLVRRIWKWRWSRINYLLPHIEQYSWGSACIRE